MGEAQTDIVWQAERQTLLLFSLKEREKLLSPIFLILCDDMTVI